MNHVFKQAFILIPSVVVIAAVFAFFVFLPRLSVSAVDSQKIDGSRFASSTKLLVEWRGWDVDHYELAATENIGNTTVRVSVPANQDSYMLTGLKSGTWYDVSLRLCPDESCLNPIKELADGAETSEEYWQLVGSGNSYEQLTKVAPDSNVLAVPLQYGDYAPKDLAGNVKLYYHTNLGLEKKGVAVATQKKIGTSTDALSSFTNSKLIFDQLCDPVQHPGKCDAQNL